MYSSEDFQHGAPPRIIGSESELNAVGINRGITDDPSYGTLSDYIQPQLFLGRDAALDGQGAFTSNGGRIYWEQTEQGEIIPGLVELSTPECLTPSELLRHERLGEAVVATTIENLARKYGVSDGLYKRTGYTHLRLPNGIVQDPDSAGHHENYFSPNWRIGTELQDYEDAFRPALNAYLATRVIWSGTGMVTHSGYVASQKAHTINLDLAPGYTQYHGYFDDKPAFNAKLDRLEIRTGEGSMSDWVLQQKFAVTSLMLRLVEHGRFPGSLLLANPTQAIRDLSINPNGYVELDNGLQITGIQHQREIAGLMKDFCDDFPETPKEEKDAIPQLMKALDDLDRTSLIESDVAAIRDRVDWAAKFSYLQEKGADPHGLTNLDAQTVMYDLKWEGLGKHNIANRWYRKFGQTILQPSPRQLSSMKPPKGRASDRVAIVKGLKTTESVDWDVVYTPSKGIFLDDPYGNNLVEIRSSRLD